MGLPGQFSTQINTAENNLDFTTRFMMTEEIKDLPFGKVWNEFCARMDVPEGLGLIQKLDGYQSKVAGRC